MNHIVFRVFIPIVLVLSIGNGVEPMSSWKIVVPELARNMVLNPSGEIAGNFAAVGGSAAQSTTYSHYGVYSYWVQTAATNQGMTLTLSALSNADHYVTLRVRGTLPAAWDWSLDNASWTTPTLIMKMDGNWSLYGASFVAAKANGATALYIYQDGAGAGSFYIDGVQVEAAAYWTTYVDGTQDGCQWDQAVHASSSTRSAYARAGGRVMDLKDDYGFGVANEAGAGVTPHALRLNEYANLPGGQLDNIQYPARPFLLAGPLRATGAGCSLHTVRRNLEDVLLPSAYPKRNDEYQPVRIWYTGGTVVKQIEAHYESGLQGNIDTNNIVMENVGLRFVANDPYWYEIGESSRVIILETGESTNKVIGRLVNESYPYPERWYGVNAPTDAEGGTTMFQDMLIAPDQRLYVVGNFTDLEGDADADRIGRYTPLTDAWDWDATDGIDNNIAYAAVLGADGDKLYVGGTFTAVGGAVANTDSVALYTISTSTWSALGTGATTGTGVRGLAFDLAGDLYAVGSFTVMGGVGLTARVAKWDGAAWNALGSGIDDGVVYAVAVDSQNNVYFAGSFTLVNGGTSAAKIVKYDGTTWTALGTGLNDTAYSLAIDANDDVYVGGNFTTAGGETANYIARWNGSRWLSVGTNDLLNNIVWKMKFGPDRLLWAVGAFSAYYDIYGGVTATTGALIWNGASWVFPGINLASTGYSVALGEASRRDDNYDVYLSWAVTGGAGNRYHAGKDTVENEGSVPVYPKFVVTRSGATFAYMRTLRNVSTGKTIWMTYALQDGETVTIDLEPKAKDIVSTFYGRRFDVVLPGSQLGQWSLVPGDNVINAFVYQGAGATASGYLLWKDAYAGYD